MNASLPGRTAAIASSQVVAAAGTLIDEAWTASLTLTAIGALNAQTRTQVTR